MIYIETGGCKLLKLISTFLIYNIRKYNYYYMARNKNAKNNSETANDILVPNVSTKPRKHTLTKDFLQKRDIYLNDKQQEMYKAIRNNTMTVVNSTFGVGKTFVAIYSALSLLADKKIDKIIISKPIIESSHESIGYLPGTLEEKLKPYENSYYSAFCKIIGKEKTDHLYSTGEIRFEPINYMRGANYEGDTKDFGVCMILDETQNLKINEICTFVTRLSGQQEQFNNSRIIILGDMDQCDLKSDKDSGFIDFINIVNGLEGVYIHEFSSDDIVRHPFLIKFAKRYEQYKKNKMLNK